MTGTVAAAISDEPVIEQTALAEVTRNFVLIRDSELCRWVILPVQRLARLDMIKTPYPGLLAVSAGLFVIAAAAFCSKQGDGAPWPFALLGAFLLVAYFASRKGTVRFLFESGAEESVTGSVKDAAALVRVVRTARQSSDGVDLLRPQMNRSVLSSRKARFRLWVRAEAN